MAANTNIHVLVVDDELSVRVSLQGWLKKFGCEVDVAEDGPAALKMTDEHLYDLILLDIKMPGMSGVEALKKIKEDSPGTIVVMITAHGSVESAVESMKIGASDYLMKPFDPPQLSLLLEKTTQQRRLIDENRLLRERFENRSGFHNLIGSSEAMNGVFRMIRDVAESDSSVLLRGETGTGKELVAKAIHALSGRSFAPFVAINCGAFTENLLESELFGYEKGAFTGAQGPRKGRLEMANGGTLFLDEVAEISAKMQVDLLRVLQEKQFHRLGNPNPIPIDFRLISATHTDLEERMGKGAFRRDFYYRINVISIEIPPLRERREDIPLLAECFLDRYARETAKRFSGISKEAMRLLMEYDWPGNVRELENVMERAVVLAKKAHIRPENLPFPDGRGQRPLSDSSLQTIIKDHIGGVLERSEWNLSRAADILGINRATLYRKMEKYNITRPVEKVEPV